LSNGKRGKIKKEWDTLRPAFVVIEWITIIYAVSRIGCARFFGVSTPLLAK